MPGVVVAGFERVVVVLEGVVVVVLDSVVVVLDGPGLLPSESVVVVPGVVVVVTSGIVVVVVSSSAAKAVPDTTSSVTTRIDASRWCLGPVSGSVRGEPFGVSVRHARPRSRDRFSCLPLIDGAQNGLAGVGLAKSSPRS